MTENTKKLAMAGVLVAVAVMAGIWTYRSMFGSGGKRPPKWVIEQPTELIDVYTLEVTTWPLGEIQKLPQQDGFWRNPKTGKFALTSPCDCPKCGAKVPVAPIFESPEAAHSYPDWLVKGVCPKCGARLPAPSR